MAGQFQGAVEARVRDGPQELDMLAWLGRVALELIGQGALGYSFDPLVADRSDTYADALKSLVYAAHFPSLTPRLLT